LPQAIAVIKPLTKGYGKTLLACWVPNIKTPMELDTEIDAIAEQIKTAKGDRALVESLKKQKQNLETERNLKRLMVIGRL
jgi:hypothetical protein